MTMDDIKILKELRDALKGFFLFLSAREYRSIELSLLCHPRARNIVVVSYKAGLGVITKYAVYR